MLTAVQPSTMAMMLVQTSLAIDTAEGDMSSVLNVPCGECKGVLVHLESSKPPCFILRFTEATSVSI